MEIFLSAGPLPSYAYVELVRVCAGPVIITIDYWRIILRLWQVVLHGN